MNTHPNARAVGRPLGVLAVLTLALLGCGSSDDDADADADATAAPNAVATTAADGAGADASTAPPTTALAEVNILTDFADVCRGISLPGATAYDAARPGVHPVMYAIGEHPSYDDVIASMPTTWDPVTGEEFTTELVACIARTEATLVQTCEGYESDDEPTGNVVEVYDATYEVRLLTATTGEEVDATTITAPGGDCPLLFFFDEGESVGKDYADPGDQLTAWMAPYVET